MTSEPIGRAGGPQSREPGHFGDLGAEIASAGRGLFALVCADPQWPGRFDLSASGFLRSFMGPLLALPLHVFGFALVERAVLAGRALPAVDFGWATLAHLIDMIAFPALIALIARPLRMGAGYTAFIIATNWLVLFLTLAFAASALLALMGEGGLGAFRLIYLVLLCASVFFVWRAGRVMLSGDVAPVLLVVVLSVAVSAMADQLAAWIVSVA